MVRMVSDQRPRDRWVHRLGNLLLLNHRKNSSASNYEFEKKKKSYFMKGGISPFPLTTQAVGVSEWTVEVVEQRQKDLLKKLMQVWRIKAELPVDEAVPELDSDDETDESKSGFHSEMVPSLEKRFGMTFIKQSRSLWTTEDCSVLVSCQVSKLYNRTNFQYWFGLTRATKEALEAHPNGYCAFGLGSSQKVLIIPCERIAKHLHCMNTSNDNNGNVRHWHVCFGEVAGRIQMILPPEEANVDVTEFLLQS